METLNIEVKNVKPHEHRMSPTEKYFRHMADFMIVGGRPEISGIVDTVTGEIRDVQIEVKN